MIVNYANQNFVYLGHFYSGRRPDVTVQDRNFTSALDGVPLRLSTNGASYDVNNVNIVGNKFGVNIAKTTNVEMFNFSFIDTNTSNQYASALLRYKDHNGAIMAKRVYADGKDGPLNTVSGGYSKTNTDFFTNNVNKHMDGANKPVFFRDISAKNFSDAIFDSKSTIYIMNATIENAYRLLRAWDGAEIVIVNSKLNIGNGEQFAWIGRNNSKIYYYNCLFDGKKTPDFSKIDISGVHGQYERSLIPTKFVELQSNPLPSMHEFFAVSSNRFSVEISVNGGSWTTMALPNSGRMDTFIGDPLFALPNLGRGEYRVRTFETTASGKKKLLSEETVGVGGVTASVASTPEPRDGFRLHIADATTNRLLFELKDGVTVDEAALAGRSLTLVADFTSGSAGAKATKSVALNFDRGAHSRIEAVAPYALFGDKDGDLFGGMTLGRGSYAFEATAYTLANAKGSVVAKIAGSFTVGAASAVQTLAAKTADNMRSATPERAPGPVVGVADPDLFVFIVDARSGARLVEVGDDARMPLGDFVGRSLALVVEAKPGGAFTNGIGSVRLDYEDGEIVAVDNVAPYAVFGETASGGFVGRKLSRGFYDLDIYVHSGPDATGRLLKTYNLDFELF